MSQDKEFSMLQSPSTARFIALGGMIAVALAIPATAQGQCEAHERVKLNASSPEVGSNYGRAVAAFGDLIVIGARGSTFVSLDGAVFVHRLQSGSWIEQARLIRPPGPGGFRFGHAVAVHGDTIVVGAPFESIGGVATGVAYVYRFDGSTWSWQATLTASTGAVDDKFGDAVSIYGEVVVIGASGKDGAGIDSGSAYIYRFDGSAWVEEIELHSSNGGERDAFGSAVSISGDVAVVGAWNNDNTGRTSGGDGRGAAYVFRFDGQEWSEEARLVSADPAPGERDGFGQAVSLDGNVLLVGTRPSSKAGLNIYPAGSAYVFRNVAGRWASEAKLVAHDGFGNDRFGYSVSLKGDVAVIGTPWVTMGTNCPCRCPWARSCRDGAAYLFRRDGAGWTERAKLTSSDLGEDDYFGTSVAVTETFAVAGAFGHDVPNRPSIGAAYVFSVIGVCCYADCDQSTGFGVLDIFDFLCFQNSFVLGDPYACDCDPDPACDIFDFLCFQNAFVAGCL
ncbi:MAG: hypothetical protein IID31_13350 [Planctomycetes bacterium]|nr:hypothetical protein [Planctomycetota bacterium]